MEQPVFWSFGLGLQSCIQRPSTQASPDAHGWVRVEHAEKRERVVGAVSGEASSACSGGVPSVCVVPSGGSLPASGVDVSVLEDSRLDGS